MLTLAALTLLVTSQAQAANAMPLSQLVHRADHVLRGDTTAALLHMRVHTASYDRTYELVYWADDRAPHHRALVKVLGPARWRGHGTLKVDGRLSLYDPRADRITVLSGSMLGDAWMGSHFTNDDLVKETDLATDYRPKLLKRWEATVAGDPATYYRVNLTPTPRAPVAWDHIVIELYQSKTEVIPVSEAYYRRGNDKRATRTLSFADVKEIGGRLAPTRWTMRVAAKPGEYTELVYDKLRMNADVPPSKFTEQALRQ